MKKLFINNGINDEKMDNHFTIEELNHFLSNKIKKSSPGLDGLRYIHLSNFDNKMLNKLIQLINKTWDEGFLPPVLKYIKFVPILKIGKTSHNHSSYRPICLISTITKCINGMLKDRLKDHIEKNQLIPNTSFGFKKNESTTTLLAVLHGKNRIFAFCDFISGENENRF
jgi:Reverse transcriptase (RNA-dependent DNA polymerase)